MLERLNLRLREGNLEIRVVLVVYARPDHRS